MKRSLSYWLIWNVNWFHYLLLRHLRQIEFEVFFFCYCRLTMISITVFLWQMIHQKWWIKWSALMENESSEMFVDADAAVSVSLSKCGHQQRKKSSERAIKSDFFRMKNQWVSSSHFPFLKTILKFIFESECTPTTTTMNKKTFFSAFNFDKWIRSLSLLALAFDRACTLMRLIDVSTFGKNLWCLRLTFISTLRLLCFISFLFCYFCL